MNLFNRRVRDSRTGREGVVTGGTTDYRGNVVIYSVTESRNEDGIIWFHSYPDFLEVVDYSHGIL